MQHRYIKCDLYRDKLGLLIFSGIGQQHVL